MGIRPVSKIYFDDIPEDLQKLRLAHKPGCIPPYIALNKNSSKESVWEAEREYLAAKKRSPNFTDTRYFFMAVYNLLFKRIRSS